MFEVNDLVSPISDELLAQISKSKPLSNHSKGPSTRYWIGRILGKDQDGKWRVNFFDPEINMIMSFDQEQLIRLCPICFREMEDSRHVSVECFYKVNEIVPQMEEHKFFSEIEEGKTYLGKTHRYPAGTVERWVTVSSEEKILDNGFPYTESKMDTVQDPVPPIRLLEKVMFTHTCCKKCRSDFMYLLKDWVAGKHVSDDGNYREGADIPVRIGGAIKYMTEKEFEEYRNGKPASPDVTFEEVKTLWKENQQKFNELMDLWEKKKHPLKHFFMKIKEYFSKEKP